MNYPMLHGSDDIRDTFLWLGGTATEDWDWRKELIPYLNKSIVYYDPYIRPEDNLDWDETARKNEQEAKTHARCQIYVIAPGMKGCFSIEEITEAVLTSKKGSVAVAILERNAGKQAQYLRGDGQWATPTYPTYTKEMRRSLDACMERWVELGAVQCSSLMGLAHFANDYKDSMTVTDFVKASSHF